MVLSEVGSTLSFSPLRLSHAGSYSCNVTVNENVYTLDGNVTLTSTLKYHFICICCKFTYDLAKKNSSPRS